MSDEPVTRLSGWCSTWGRPDQFHDYCRSTRCECPNRPNEHGCSVSNQPRNNPCGQGETTPSSGKMGRAEPVREHRSGSDHPSFRYNERG